MTPPEGDWPATPGAAREQFLARAKAHGWAVESHPLGQGHSLDAAVWPGDPERGTLILTGGVHGVEAPLGVMACAEFFHRCRAPKERVILIPVVNPVGYELGRRTDGANVDLNRNFLLPGERFEGSPPHYRTFDPALNPWSPPPAWGDDFLWRAGVATARHGWPALKDTVAGGQYDFPQGLFFGGHRYAESVVCLARHWPRWLEPARVARVVARHWDFHTGLGPYAEFRLLLDPGTPHDHLHESIRYGPTEVSASAGVSYTARGTLGPWARRTSGVADYRYACVEFGTYSGLRMVQALRHENRTHHTLHNTPRDRDAKARLRDRFIPSDPRWRARVIEAVRRLIDQRVADASSPV